MSTFALILKILALVFFLVATFTGYGRTDAGWARTNFIALGLAFWVGSDLIDPLVK
jgi:hypothetical protein